MNRRRLREQFKFLRYIGRLKDRDLRALHKEKFKDTPFEMDVPTSSHRDFLTRRLWFFYCLCNYHYERNTKVYKMFRQRALTALKAPYDDGHDRMEEVCKTKAKEIRMFTLEKIKRMDTNLVDRYLATLGIYAQVEPHERKQMLFEYFHKQIRPSKQRQYEQGAGRLNNKYCLRDLILAGPEMSFNQFGLKWGNDMPTVTESSYNNARCLLRRAGYKLPYLRTGPSDPAVIRIINPNGQVRRGRDNDDFDE